MPATLVMPQPAPRYATRPSWAVKLEHEDGSTCVDTYRYRAQADADAAIILQQAWLAGCTVDSCAKDGWAIIDPLTESTMLLTVYPAHSAN